MEMAAGTLVEIGITTRNRWDDLKDTLQKIRDFGLSDLRVLVFDDGSEQKCPYDIFSFCKRLTFKRFSESRGLIVRRNQLARAMTSKYYLSLDDDSYPVSGSLEKAVELAESLEDLLGLSFPIYNPVTKKHQVRSLKEEPYRVRSFIGCGHLLHRERFLQIGGYREELVHFGEEVDLTVRGFQQGLYCYHYPNLQIHHTASNAGRNWERMDFYGARNAVLWNDWFMPSGLRSVKQVRTAVSRVIQVVKNRRLGQAKGELAGLKQVGSYKHNRRPMSRNLYREWIRLPQG